MLEILHKYIKISLVESFQEVSNKTHVYIVNETSQCHTNHYFVIKDKLFRLS